MWFINEEKSKAFYGAGVNEELKREIFSIVGIKEGTLPVKYLGIPLSSNQLKTHFRPLIEKVRNSILGWATKSLSYAGRLELVKRVSMGVIGYWAQQIVIPKKVMAELDKIMRDFIWGSQGRGAKRLNGTQSVCLRKKEG